MKDDIKPMINGLEDENLGVFGPLREPKQNGIGRFVLLPLRALRVLRGEKICSYP